MKVQRNTFKRVEGENKEKRRHALLLSRLFIKLGEDLNNKYKYERIMCSNL